MIFDKPFTMSGLSSRHVAFRGSLLSCGDSLKRQMEARSISPEDLVGSMRQMAASLLEYRQICEQVIQKHSECNDIERIARIQREFSRVEQVFQATDDCRNRYITLDAFYNVQDQTLPRSGILADKPVPTSRLNLNLTEHENEGSQASVSDTACKSADHTVLDLEVLETELENVAARLEGSLAETWWHKSQVRRKKNDLKKRMIGKEASVVVEGLNQPTHHAQWSDLGNVSLQYDSPFTSTPNTILFEAEPRRYVPQMTPSSAVVQDLDMPGYGFQRSQVEIPQQRHSPVEGPSRSETVFLPLREQTSMRSPQSVIRPVVDGGARQGRDSHSTPMGPMQAADPRRVSFQRSSEVEFHSLERQSSLSSMSGADWMDRLHGLNCQGGDNGLPAELSGINPRTELEQQGLGGFSTGSLCLPAEQRPPQWTGSDRPQYSQREYQMFMPPPR